MHDAAGQSSSKARTVGRDRRTIPDEIDRARKFCAWRQNMIKARSFHRKVMNWRSRVPVISRIQHQPPAYLHTSEIELALHKLPKHEVAYHAVNQSLSKVIGTSGQMTNWQTACPLTWAITVIVRNFSSDIFMPSWAGKTVHQKQSDR